MQSMIASVTHGSITASLWDDLRTVEGNIALNFNCFASAKLSQIVQHEPLICHGSK